VVRRRLRSDPVLRLRGRSVHGNRTPRPRAIPSARISTRASRTRATIFFSRASRRAAAASAAVLRRSDRRRFDRCFAFVQSAAEHTCSPTSDTRAAKRSPVRRARTRVPAHPPRRYVEFQPHVRPRHPLRSQAGGRIESILASLPPLVAWRYDWKPEPGTRAELYEKFCGRATGSVERRRDVASSPGPEETIVRIS